MTNPTQVSGDSVQVDRELEDLIPGFLENRLKDVVHLRELLQQANLEEMARVGHRLKGTSGGYGFAKLSEIGKGIEDAAKSGNLTLIADLISVMDAHLKAVKIEFVG